MNEICHISEFNIQMLKTVFPRQAQFYMKTQLMRLFNVSLWSFQQVEVESA